MDYNTEFQNNNTELEEILEAITNMPNGNVIIAEHNADEAAHPYIQEQLAEIANNTVQSDYAQNDSTANDYIKNRPFYENDETVIQIDEKFIPESIARITGINDMLAEKANLSDITVKYEGDKLYGLIEGNWQELVIKSQPIRASVQVAEDGTSVITIPEVITSLECVDVYQNGLYLSEGINYTLDTSARTVSLMDYTADANDVFAFVAY